MTPQPEYSAKQMAHDVFISYPRENKPIADAVCSTLEVARIRCWIAPRDIVPSHDWGAAIIEAIEGARALVVVFSSYCNTSKHVHREVERAVAKGIAIVPFRIEDVVPGKQLEYFLSSPHWLDALTPPLEARILELADALQRLLGTSGITSHTAPKSAEEPTKFIEVPPTDWNRQRGVLGLMQRWFEDKS